MSERDMREFLSSFQQRQDAITQEMISAMWGGFRELAAATQGSLRSLQDEIADQREQIQANTEAILRVLDRLDGTEPNAS